MSAPLNQLLSQKKLSEIKILKISRHNVTSLLKDEHSNLFVMKRPRNSGLRDRLIYEINAILAVRRALCSMYKRNTIIIKWYSRNPHDPFYIYKYIDGVSSGVFLEDYGIKIGFTHKYNFYSLLNFINKIGTANISNPKSWTKKHAVKEYKKYISFLRTKKLDRLALNKVENYLEKMLDDTFKSLILCNRDLYPENVLYTDDNQFSIIDYEYFSLTPIGFPYAFMYYLYWREEFWRTKTYTYYTLSVNTAYHKKTVLHAKGKNTSLCFCIVILGLRFLYQLYSSTSKIDKERQWMIDFIKHSVSTAMKDKLFLFRNIKFAIEKRDIDKILKLYDLELGAYYKYEVYYASHGNTVVKIFNKKNAYIIRIYSITRNLARIRRELKLYPILESSSIISPRIINSIQGGNYSRIYLYGRYRYLTMLTYIKGKRIKQAWANENSATALGRFLRSIHDHNVIHGDFSKENVFFYKAKPIGVIDFEWGEASRNRVRKNRDMMKAIALWITDVRHKKISNRLFIDSFLKGYFGYKVTNGALSKIISAVITEVISLRIVHSGDDKSNKIRFDAAIVSLRKMYKAA